MNIKVIKIIGVVASVGGAALSLLGGWAADKQLDAKITDKVSEALTNATKGES